MELSKKRRFQQKFLKPLKQRCSKRPIVTFDIESENWKDFVFCGIYDGKTYNRFDSINEVVKELITHKNRGKLIFAHNMGKFDGQFLLDEIIFRHPEYSVIPIINGGRMLEMRIQDKDRHNWHIRDSYAILPASLKQLTVNFDVKHKKLEEDLKGMLTNPEYNKNDCIGLYEVLMKFKELNNGYFGMTISQTSLADYRMNYQRQAITTNREYEDVIRKSYYGGRTEIFKFNLDMDKKFYYYDVNSLYPSVLRKYDYPHGEFKPCAPDIDKFGFSYATIGDTHYFPVVPHREGKKMLFMQGMKTGWFSNQELKYLEQVSYVDADVKKTLACEEHGPIFREYVDDVYAKRLEAKAQGNKALDYILKIKLNSFYGKFGQRREKEKIIINPQFIEAGMLAEQLGDRLIFKKLEKSESSHIIPAISAMVTANARLHMHRYMHNIHPDLIYYMDTDSLILSKKLFDNSKKIGEMKLECEMSEFLSILPKVYHFKYEDGSRCLKAKGVRFNDRESDYVNLGLFRDYISGKQIKDDRGIETFKRSIITTRMKKSNTILFNKSVTRSLKSFYDKRRIVPDNDLDYRCEPFVMGEDRSVNQKPFKEMMERALTCLANTKS